MHKVTVGGKSVHFDDLDVVDVFGEAAKVAETPGVDSWAAVYFTPARDAAAARFVIRAACEHLGVEYDEAKYAKGSEIIAAFTASDVDLPDFYEEGSPDPKAQDQTTPG